MSETENGDRIRWSRQEDVALTWIHPGQEFRDRKSVV